MDANQLVASVLAKQRKDNEKYKSTVVEKHLEINLDLGRMLVIDYNEFDEKEIKNNTDDYLTNLTRDNVQLLVNDIWQLPTERVEESVVAMLPEPKLPLPRSRKLPEPKVLSRWEQFAKSKGLKKTKKDKKVYDEVLGKWVPTYGYQHKKAEKEKDWCMEVPKNVDPMTDMFQEKRDLRLEKISKNEINRMKNIARAKKIKLPRAGFIGEASATSKELSTAVSIAKNSTASVGKFQDKLAKEKAPRGLGVHELLPGSKKRKRLPDTVGEKSKNLELVESILKKRPKIDIDKAIQMQRRENRQKAEAGDDDDNEKSGGGGKKGSGRKGIKGKKRGGTGKKGQKPKGSHGVRSVAKRKSFGRKRR